MKTSPGGEFAPGHQEEDRGRVPESRPGFDLEPDPRAAALRWVALVCAALLFLAVLAPRELARLTVHRGNRGGMSINDDPSGYVGLVTLCGLIALPALVATRAPRGWGVTGAVVAGAAFAGALWVTARYWRGFANGERQRDAREWVGRRGVVEFPVLLPGFTLIAGLGLVCTTGLLAIRLRRAAV